MPNSTAITDSFKRGLLTANANLNIANVRAALYYVGANLSNANAVYTGVNATAGEVSGAGYPQGGVGCTPGTVAMASNIAYWQPGGAISYGTVTISSAFDAVLLYWSNTTVGGAAVTTANTIASFNFGSTTVNNGTFTINLPTNNETLALIRLT